MRLRLGLLSVASLAVVAVSTAISSFVVDPENIGARLALYALAFLALLAAVLCGVFALVLPIFGSRVAPAQVDEARAAGREALARVRSSRATGGQLNGAWAYDVRLVVASTDVPAYEVSDRVRVHRNDGKLTGQGELVTVVRLAADAPQVVVTKGPGETPQDAAVPREAPAWPGA
jgi:hypothetical protein